MPSGEQADYVRHKVFAHLCRKIWDVKDVGPLDTRLYFFLVDRWFRSDHEDSVSVSNIEVAEALRCEVRNAMYTRKKLVSLGLLEFLAGKNRYSCPTYRFEIPIVECNALRSSFDFQDSTHMDALDNLTKATTKATENEVLECNTLHATEPLEETMVSPRTDSAILEETIVSPTTLECNVLHPKEILECNTLHPTTLECNTLHPKEILECNTLHPTTLECNTLHPKEILEETIGSPSVQPEQGDFEQEIIKNEVVGKTLTLFGDLGDKKAQKDLGDVEKSIKLAHARLGNTSIVYTPLGVEDIHTIPNTLLFSNKEGVWGNHKEIDAQKNFEEVEGVDFEYPDDSPEIFEKNAKKEIGSGAKKKRPKPLAQRQQECAERIEKFWEQLVPHIAPRGKYSRDMVEHFFGWWTQTNDTKTLTKRDKQTFFDVSRRLSYWARSNNEKKKAPSNGQGNFFQPQSTQIEDVAANKIYSLMNKKK